MRHVARIIFITLALALLGLALTPKASPAQAAGPCDPNRAIPYWWHLRPAVPCSGDSVSIVFGWCGECVEFATVTPPGEAPLTLYFRMKPVCPAITVCTPDSAVVPLGAMAAGNYALLVRVQAGVVHGDTGYCVVTRHDTLRFAITCPPPPPPPPADSLPYVQNIVIGGPGPCNTCPPVACPDQPIPLHIDGMFPSGCYRLRGLELVPLPTANFAPAPPIVRLTVDHRTCGICTLDTPPFSADTVLPALPAGTYRLMVQLVEVDRCNTLVAGTSTYHDTRPFTVVNSCGPPPPPANSLPYVSEMVIGLPMPCPPPCKPVICPRQPIPFHVAGAFPDDCLEFRKIELVPSMLTVIGPPIVRITVAQNDCLGRPCLMRVTPWSANAVLPGLPPGQYRLPVEMALVSWCDSTKVDTVYRVVRTFTVRDSCGIPPPGGCVMAGWDHSQQVGRCDAWLGPDHLAQVGMTIASPVALAGLQGTLSLDPPGLAITRLVPIGPAEGMHVAWERTNEGVRFVMFAEHGAPIGGVRDCGDNVRCMQQPVLAVVVGPGPTDGLPPPVTHVMAHDLLGSDSLGVAVPECQIETALIAVSATICTGVSCDFNRDGTLDVRDLVTMVHCVLGNGPCPDTTRANLDCNRDGRLNVDDVLCCARRILHDGVRDTVPGRPEPDVAVDFGEPAWGASGLEVPVRLRGADRVGAARLALALPLDRYDVTGVELGEGGSQWLALHEVVDGKLVLGLIGLGAGAAVEEPARLDLKLHLVLKPGQSAGGDVGLDGLEASGPDGATLVVATTPHTVPLPAPGVLVLSPARPNPFGRETRFALNLERSTDVEIAVHDLSGRRVATLYRGTLGAGPHDFTWRGARDDGSTAPNGIYFLQARVGNERLTRKVIFLPGD